jgi:hypothetical protein
MADYAPVADGGGRRLAIKAYSDRPANDDSPASNALILTGREQRGSACGLTLRDQPSI